MIRRPAASAPVWTLRSPHRGTVQDLMRKHDVPELVAILLANRGYSPGEAVSAHMAPDLRKLHDPFLLPNMREATRVLRKSVEDGETILIHGDYDVDGVTGTVLLVRLLRLFGADVHWHIPDRFKDGYSFGDHSIERAKAEGAKLVISVDNGTSAIEPIAQLKAIGVKTIVTDHHEPPVSGLPEAVAIVNPKLRDSTYPFPELCGGAVAFKLAWGFCQEMSDGDRVKPELRQFLVDSMGDVAIATVCDVVPLVDENRILARHGLKALESSSRPGVKALLSAAGISNRALNAEDVSFQIGPRINASGRLATAARAVEVLLSEDDAEAARLAAELDTLNVKRREIERDVLVEAEADAKLYQDAQRYPVIVVAGQGWHQGVVGIVAARLVDKYARPALVIGLDGDMGRGSARSVPGFSVLEAMHGGAAFMPRYGGHSQAAGCEVMSESIDDLREAICEEARRILGGAGYPPPELAIDAAVPLTMIDQSLLNQVDRLQPYGQLNESPVLLSRDVRLAEPARVIGADGRHVILQVRQGDTVHKALAFGMANRVHELEMGIPIHLVHTPRWNTFRGQRNLELLVHDFAVGESPV